MELPCTALSVDIETTGCWPGVHKIVAIGVALFQLLPTHQVAIIQALSARTSSVTEPKWGHLVGQVIELDRKLFQFKVNYPQDFDEITMRDFWHVQGRMELLDMLQKDAKCEEEAIKEFYDYYTEVRLSLEPLLLYRFSPLLCAQVCHRHPKFYLITDNPVMDLGFINLSIATKLRKPPLTYRPLPPSTSKEAAVPATPTLPVPHPSGAISPGVSETESDEEPTTEDIGEEEDDDGDNFGESGEEDCEADEQQAVPRLVISKSADKPDAKDKETQANPSIGSFYDNYSAPHFAVDLNSLACGLIGLHLPPFRKASGSRWASPADFLSFHKPYMICPYRKTHDPVDDASYNCWQFLQCISILWMSEYAELYSARKEHSFNGSSPLKCERESNDTTSKLGLASNVDAEFPTIASANAASKEKKPARAQRRGRIASVSAVTPVKGKDHPSSPSNRQKQVTSPRKHSNASKTMKPAANSTGAGPIANCGAPRAYRRNVRSNSDPVPPSAITMSASCAVIANSKSAVHAAINH